MYLDIIKVYVIMFDLYIIALYAHFLHSDHKCNYLFIYFYNNLLFSNHVHIIFSFCLHISSATKVTRFHFI